ncbi:MAG: polysaccharide biosynthesis C-terminal protein [Actinomycetota bacterium]|nr:polysaccharide biosynthesis C-terminal protein [Actinomycetota bacterium]
MSAVDPVTARTEEGRDPLGRAARHGALGLIGAICAGASGFLLTLVVGRVLDKHDVGVFFTAVALFTILNGILLLGSDTGLVRSLPGLIVTGRSDRIRPTIAAALLPVTLAATTVSVVGLLAAEPVARALFGPEVSGDLERAMRLLAPFLVLSTLSTLLLNGVSRGLGAMRTFTLGQQILLPAGRPVAVAVAVLLGAHALGALVGWALPVVLVCVMAVHEVRRLLQRFPREGGGWGGRSEVRAVAGPFWRLTAPRGLAAAFEILIVWSDVVLVTVLYGPAEAGIYAAASRFVTSGTMALQALRLAIGPLLAASFTRGDLAEAARVHRFSAQWAILTTWPVYLALGLFAPAVLSLLGDGFSPAGTALGILSAAMLGVVAAGNANTVLNMAGRSSWAAVNTGIAATVMVVLDVLLVPEHGMVGAAIGWAAAMLTDATLGVWEIRRGLRVRSFDRGTGLAAVLALGGFGLPATLWVLLVPAPVGRGSLAGLGLGGLVASGVYGLLVARYREKLGVAELLAGVRGKNVATQNSGEERGQ